MDLCLADHVHAIMIDEDAVFLDVATNAYFCLPAISEVLSLEGRTLTIRAEALGEDLLAAGLASATRSPAPVRGLPAQPARTARAVLQSWPSEARRGPRLHHWIVATGAGLANAGDQRRRFADRVRPARTQPSPPADNRLLADLDAFRRLSPWLPFDGVCLYRSGLLRRYLSALGHQVDWVFGVRTWPFAAHCWLQAGDLALDDEAERLLAYHPIMVI